MRKLLLLLIIVLSFAFVPIHTSKAAITNSLETLSIPASTTAQRPRYRRYRRYRGPIRATTAPVGATARCRDGTYSFSQHRRGTCSWHGGVAQWL